MQITFDFREQATRDQILDMLLDLFSDVERDRFEEIMAKAAIPDKHHHTVIEVNESIDALEVPEAVKEDLHAVYGILAAAEAKVHGCSVDQTHFHEVGEASGIRNALAICAAFHVIDPEQVVATPIQPGAGTIECAHGTLPIPAPATAAILDGLPLVEGADRLPGERCTPTSAALIRHFVTSFEG